MDYNYQAQMQKKLTQMLEEGLFQNRCITVFGSNEPAEQMIAFLKKANIQVEFLLDNNKKKIGSFFEGIPIKKPEEALGKFRQDILILIISKHYYEMLEQLQDLGYKEDTHVIKVVEMSRFANNSLSEETFEQYQKSALQGEIIYRDIQLKYPEMDFLFVFPVKAIGDVFLGTYCAIEYSANQGIFHPIFAVVGEGSKKTVMALGYKEVVSMTQEEMNCLERFYLLCEENIPILAVNHKKPYTCGLGRIGNYNKLDFASLFQYGLYELKEDIRNKRTEKNQEKISYAKELLIKHQLPQHKTVILAPYAKTAARIEMQFWEHLADALKKKGYSVCTNVGTAEEVAVLGTQPLDFSLEYAKEILEIAGTFIGLRSGFCDLISQAECKKIIFYPDRIYGTNEFIDFFSLSNMGLSDDITEIVFCKEKQEKIIEELLAIL